MEILKATQDDWVVISEIAYASWQLAYATVLSQDQIDFMLNLSYSETGLSDAMGAGQQFYLLRLEDEIIGFIAVLEKENVLRIEKLYLRPEAQGLGAGKYFVSFTEKLALSRGFVTLELNVNRNNKAYYFYLKQGFKVIQSIDTPYYGYILDDYVMHKNLTTIPV